MQAYPHSWGVRRENSANSRRVIWQFIGIGCVLMLSLMNALAGQIVLVDFGSGNGTPTLGGTWNTLSTGTSNLVDTSNSGTAVGVFPSGFGAEAFGDYWLAGNKDWVDREATGDGLTFFNKTAQIIVQGLDSNKTYRVDLVASRSFTLPFGHVGDFTINGSFGDSSPNGDDFDTFNSGNGGAILRWDSVTPGELQSGATGFSLMITTTGEIAVKAMRLEVMDGGGGVPMPFSLLPVPQIGQQGVTVTWESVAGKTYQVLYKNSLDAAQWSLVPGTVMATGSTASKLDATAPLDGSRLYLVEELQQN